MTFQQQVQALIAALDQAQHEVVKKFLLKESLATFWYDELQVCIDEVRKNSKDKGDSEDYYVFSAICKATRTLDEVAAL